MNVATRAAALTVGAGALVAGWSFGVEPRFFAVRRATLPVLPDGAEPIRVLHLSDLHLVPRQAMKRDWVRGLSEWRPDLVVNTGDNLAAADAVPAVLETYGELLDVPGVFVFGSNDYYGPKPRNPFRYFFGPSRIPRSEDLAKRALPVEDLRAGFTAAGWHDLNNASARASVKGTDLSFSGVDDPHIDRDDVRAIRFDDDATRVGVLHAPYSRILDAFAGAGADVLFAGHTHGGQIRVPFWGAPVTNCDLRHDQARGVIDWQGIPVNVSAGLGYSPYAPLRFACRPEVSLLTLVSRSS